MCLSSLSHAAGIEVPRLFTHFETDMSKKHSAAPSTFVIPLWAYIVALVAMSTALYLHTNSYSYTELDDSIFIREFESYNRADSNYVHSFKRGVFNETGDTYYRPLLLNSFVFDRQAEGHTSSTLHAEGSNDSIERYHWTNLILHLVALVLLFFVLQTLRISNTLSFVICSIVAVHPALVQAVSWIPGRNDTMLAVFVYIFMLSALRFAGNQRWWLLLIQGCALLLAMFSKETALISAPLVFFLLVFQQKISWKHSSLWLLTLSWFMVGGIWFYFRSNATVQNQDISLGAFLGSFVERLPLVLQYLGKILLPFNLAVVPYQEQTSLLFGLVALVLLAVLVWLSRQQDWTMMITGLVWFAFFILPVLLVPKSLNKEAYEHRLYVPMVGILMLLVHTDAVKRLSEKRILLGTAILIVALFSMSYLRTDLFSNRIAFWESAVRTAPESAYCNMMLGARYVLDKTNPRRAEGEALINKAYALDSTEKYVNYYVGLLYWDRGSILASEPYFQRETLKNPYWPELYFRLARCAIERRDLVKGREYLERHFVLNPHDAQGINNLLMVLLDSKLYQRADEIAKQVRANGDVVPPSMKANIETALKAMSAADSSTATSKK